ncbi:Tetraspanin family protein [Prunus dulcis]|uniref:Tetraspanin family protein n=1 Tax=Prunus dulcis TaxID=3755 RepID=A0A4Y1S048_PRUDU|nr:Tetraspanin family protein [Prunus dulcis]
MRPFVLKFLNFLQAFIGVSILVYSAWMLNQWNNHIPIVPQPSAPSPDSSSFSSLLLSSETAKTSDQITPLNFAVHLVSGFDEGLGLNSFKLPAPCNYEFGDSFGLWAIGVYLLFYGLGVLICCITFIGCIAAESINGCCLCFVSLAYTFCTIFQPRNYSAFFAITFKYTILITVLTLLEAALVAFIAIDHRWEKDLPFDPTGELDSLRSFVQDNTDVCRWAGLAVIVLQALSLLLAMVLRGMVSTHKADYDVEDDYDFRGRTREPLLNNQLSQASGSTKGDGRGTHSDIWSSRIRDKYGLNTVNQNASASDRFSLSSLSFSFFPVTLWIRSPVKKCMPEVANALF